MFVPASDVIMGGFFSRAELILYSPLTVYGYFVFHRPELRCSVAFLLYEDCHVAICSKRNDFIAAVSGQFALYCEKDRVSIGTNKAALPYHQYGEANGTSARREGAFFILSILVCTKSHVQIISRLGVPLSRVSEILLQTYIFCIP